jgi:hypothetical protein
MEALSKLFELLKIPIEHRIGAFVVSAAIVLLPDKWLTAAGVLQYREKGKPYFWLLFILVTISLIAAIVGVIKFKIQGYCFKRSSQKRLLLLTTDEKNVLRRYIEGETRSLYLDIGSPLVQGLVDEKIIYRSTNISSPMHGFGAFGFNIQPWAWEYLNDHRDLLK